MRRRGLLVLMFTIAAAVVAHAQQQWVEHRPAAAGYRIEFPGQPAVTSEAVKTAVGTITVHFAEVNVGQYVSFLALHNAYPKGALGDPMDALSRGRDSVLKAKPIRKLRSEQNLSVGGAPAKRFIVDEGSLVIVDLAVVSGDNLYQAIFVSPQGSENSPDGERFLSSFALVAR